MKIKKIVISFLIFLNMLCASCSLQNSHIIYFDASGGTTNLSQVEVNDGDLIRDVVVANKEDCFFLGWYLGKEESKKWEFTTDRVYSSFTLFAHYSSTYATIKFDLNLPSSVDKDSINLIDDIYLSLGEKIVFPSSPTLDGFSFKGWCLEDNIVDEDYIVNSSIVLQAKWIKTYRVNFSSSIGNYLDPINVEENGVILLPDIISDGFALSCWCLDSQLNTRFDESTLITSNLTLYAKFEEETNKDYFYFGTKDSKGYGRITGIKKEAFAFLNNEIVIPKYDNNGNKIGRFQILNYEEIENELLNITSIVLPSFLYESPNSALSYFTNLISITGAISGNYVFTYCDLVYQNNGEYNALSFIPLGLQDTNIRILNNGKAVSLDSNAITGDTFYGVSIKNIRCFVIKGDITEVFKFNVYQNVDVVFAIDDTSLSLYTPIIYKDFIVGDSSFTNGILALIPLSKIDDSSYIQETIEMKQHERDVIIQGQIGN